jgi:hypothetical protein
MASYDVMRSTSAVPYFVERVRAAKNERAETTLVPAFDHEAGGYSRSHFRST